MKKIYLNIILLLLLGCSSGPISKSFLESVDCPSILFASEHKVYMGSSSNEISLDNITYKAEINNVIFSNKCQIKNNIFSSDLSILFVVQPLGQIENIITLPYYLAIIDQNQNVKNIEYFLLQGKIKKNIETKELIETEFIENITVNFGIIDEESTLIIGFMLDKKRIELLN